MSLGTLERLETCKLKSNHAKTPPPVDWNNSLASHSKSSMRLDCCGRSYCFITDLLISWFFKNPLESKRNLVRVEHINQHKDLRERLIKFIGSVEFDPGSLCAHQTPRYYNYLNWSLSVWGTLLTETTTSICAMCRACLFWLRNWIDVWEGWRL